ncbi:alpha/beta hydrolase [Rossellomorea sp. RS05]|uniref:lipase/acyltransferase domain-containing protein n=1 Tax=Rossellomorea sp. RS05 TaxID=3149166 RepID=UPI00322194C5
MIVFVPGIKGSELFEGDNKRWFPSTEKDMDLLDIKNELQANSIIRHVTPYGATKFTKYIYKGILDEFGESSFSLFPYDWRKSILDHVDSLVSTIMREYEATGESVTVVAHSMGGLLAKAALLKINDEGLSDKVNKLVTIGTPWNGAPDSFKALLYGEPGIFEDFTNIFQFANTKATRKIARMYPSVYQLLPNETYFRNPDGNFIATKDGMDMAFSSFKTMIQNLHDSDKEESEFVDVWKTYIDPLQKVLSAELPEEIQHDCLIGYDQATLYRVPEKISKAGELLKKYKNPSEFKNGDGVVPLHSAVPIHTANLYYVKGEHSSLCSYPNVAEFIKWSTGYGQVEDLPKGIITNDSDVAPKNNNLVAGFMTRIMCPVESTIVDEEGKYVAGVFDTSISEISELSSSEKVKFFNIGESKYAYFPQDIPEELAFEINAYKEGIAQVSIEVFDKSEVGTKSLRFDTIPVSKDKSAKLRIPGKEKVDASVLEYQGEYIEPKIMSPKDKESVKKHPIPKIDVNILPHGNTKKTPYLKAYSGPVTIYIESDEGEFIDELFFSIDGKDVRKYKNNELIDLESGQYTIEAFGRDIFDRVIKSSSKVISIEKNPPKTKAELFVDPEGILLQFTGQSVRVKPKTHFRILEEKDLNSLSEENVKWEEVTEQTNKIKVPTKTLRGNKNSKVTIEFYSEITDFELKEEIQTLEFSLGEIPMLMWEETTSAVTPKLIWDSLFQLNQLEINEYNIEQNVQNKYTKIDQNQVVGDNVKSVRFSSEFFNVEVFFSEKYSLYFSGPPTELLKQGQKYKFSFELRTERGNEKIITTNPTARLKAVKAKNIKDKILDLTEKDGTFFGSFTVDGNFIKYKHRLIVTDQKNVSPPLRDTVLILGEEDKD